MRYPPIQLRVFVAICFSMVLYGCHREPDVRRYRIPKESAVEATSQPTSMPVGHALPPGHPMPSERAAAAPITWKVPDGWREFPPAQMRYANFAVTAEDLPVVAVSIMKSQDILLNVQRWQSQVGLPPATEADLNKLVIKKTIGGFEAFIFNFVGPQNSMLAAIIRSGDQDWVFKLIGPANIVAGQKAAFDGFIDSVRITPNPHVAP